jgi:pyridoxine 5'-phosphate synthase PdxJ
MNDERPSRRSLDSLKKEAKRWLAALRIGAADARARLERTLGSIPDQPTLRDVQHALAREHGFPGWSDLKHAVDQAAGADRDAGAKALAQYDTMVEALLEAYRTGTPEAMERLYQYTWHRRTWEAMRRYVQLDLGRRPAGTDDDVDITVDDARYIVAVDNGFSDWDALKAFATATTARSRTAAKPVRLVQPDAGMTEDSPTIASSRDWDAIIRSLATHPSVRLHAAGQMTDTILADITSIANVENIVGLDLGGSQGLTDDGLRHLARLPKLKHLDISNTGITDRGLDVLRDLPALETISLAMTRTTDDGAANLAHCHALERVNLSWTRTGDGALRALAGKEKLRSLQSGGFVTDAGIPLLHDLPVFKTWHGGEPKIALLSYDSEPNRLMLRGSFTDRGMQHMRGLDGLFGLNVDDSNLGITAAALPPLTTLPNLGWLGVDAKDDWMPYIADMPRLRFLGAQDTPAGDDGFEALSKSRSLEYIWGRRCHNLRRRGILALATMPALRGLSVSCLNVDDAGVAALPTFPALRELMPMDVPDAGYRHIGKCGQLESLILMYCRDTTDAATEHITGLSELSYYFNSYTTITDRTPALLSGMDSLERITFDACHGLTNAGVARLARLPKLRELRVSGRQITTDVVELFPTRISVHAGG